MTTGIAVRGWGVAGDTRVTVGTKIGRVGDKTFSGPDGSVFVCAGDLESIRMFREYVMDGSDEMEPPELSEFEGLEVLASGGIRSYVNSVFPFDVEDAFCCIGTGGDFAAGFMYSASSVLLIGDGDVTGDVVRAAIICASRFDAMTNDKPVVRTII